MNCSFCYRFGTNLGIKMRIITEAGPLLRFFVMLTMCKTGLNAQSLMNRAPHFLPGGDMARFSLPEDTRVGSPVYRLRGTDPEGSIVHYSISGEQLTVDRTSGIVTLLRPLDREAIDLVEVIISITDEGIGGSEPNTVSLRREIPILDVNDNPPEFHGRPYSFAVAETSQVGSTLYSNISITDNDGGVNADIDLVCVSEKDNEDVCSTFGIETEKIGEGDYVGIIYLLKPLDYEQRSGYSLVLKATDLASDPTARLTAVAKVAIDIVDIQDQPPIFLNAPFSATVAEGTPSGTSILTVQARDGDLGDPRNVLLTVDDDSLGYFKLLPHKQNPDSSISVADLVTTNRSIDREHPDILQNGGIYAFSIKATELINNELPGDTTSSQVTIVITDIDDQIPTFNEDNFHINVSEDIGADTPLPGLNMVVNDRDVGENARYTLKLEDIKNSAGIFRVHPTSATGRTPVVIRVTDIKGLDYDGLDTEVGRSRVTVTLVDANDNSPVFPQSSYHLRVSENTNAGFLISNITATDIDSNEYGNIVYAIKGFGAEKFYTKPKEGGLYVAKSSIGLDYEAEKSYSLTFEARDGGGRISTVNLYIEVEDVNDNAPVFELREYSRTVREGATSFQPQLFVRQSTPQVKFIIVKTSLTGQIRVSPDARLDLETGGSHYDIIVHAVDSGTPIRETATATVAVDIIDVNNKPPAFPTNDAAAFVRYISERTPIGMFSDLFVELVIMNNEIMCETVLTVKAVDPDSNAQLNYTIVEPIRAGDRTGVALKSTSSYNYKTAFKINSTTGELTVAQPLDHQAAAVIIFNVRVDDMKAFENKDKQFAKTEVTIYIQAYSDKNPQFSMSTWTPTNPIITVSVPEEQAIGSTIVTLVAMDPLNKKPITKFEEVKSAGLQDADDYVRVDSHSGNITLNKRLDYENMQQKSLSFQVRAIADDNKRISEATVIINVEDINDNSPLFSQESYKTQVLESAKHPQAILTVKARDLDINDNTTGYGAIRYSLSGESSNLFVIDPISGIIVVAPNVSLDREKQSLLRFTVVAADTPQGGNEQRKTSAIVMIDVLDVNDNAPSFTKTSYSAVVPENVPIGTDVITMTALDPDEDSGGEITYDLSNEGEANGLFAINHTTGNIITKKQLTGKGRTESYNLMVRAQDGGNPSLSTDVALNIYIGDVFSNDGVPFFVRPTVNEIAKISENSSIGSPVFQIMAADPDDPNTPNDGDTGLISTKLLLDREQKENYTLIIVIQDHGEPPQQATRILQVQVLDIDDHKPIFKRGLDDDPQVFMVQEEVDIGTEIGTVEAVDEDIDGNEEGLFAIDTSENKGLITIARRVDRESASEHILTIKCFKKSTTPFSLRKQYNRQDPSETQVKIKVQDIDDNNPSYLRDNITIGVRLNVPVDTALLTLEAHDIDSEAKPIAYRLVNSTFFSLAPSIIDTVPVPANLSMVFRLDNRTGELRTASSMVGFVDGFFELQVTANNTDIPGKEANTTIKIFVLRDRDLLKFVFSKPPTDVRRVLNDFQKEVEKALLLPVSLNIYDTQFYAKEDGSLDFSSTRVKLRCAPLIAKAEASWIQLWVLAIACFIGVGAFMAGIVTCCLYGRYKRQSKRGLLRDCPRVPVSSIGYLSGTGCTPAMIITPPSAISEGPRMYEWAHEGSVLPPGHDNMSYQSFPTR
ncbi:hypothetical protein C0J52_07794 [Blattella germanica]|nr:hypothetical protein C0J52_07794 [Blattella germanica]